MNFAYRPLHWRYGIWQCGLSYSIVLALLGISGFRSGSEKQKTRFTQQNATKSKSRVA